jgi:hypothetical protein
VATIDRVRDERIYGLFPAFREFLRPAAIQAAIEQLRGIREHMVGDIIAAVPAAWDLNAATRLALRALILDRAAFLAGDSRAFEARLLG